MRFVTAIVAVCGALLLQACAQKLPDVSGTWVAYQNSPMGEMEFVVRMSDDTQGRLTGTITTPLRPLRGNAYALALVNEGGVETEATVSWAELKLPKKLKARDLWEKKDLGTLAGDYSARIPSHGAVLLRLQE